MPELRFDQTTGDWVVFAPSRLRRPHDVVREKLAGDGNRGPVDGCPFCPGNETLTPPEVYAVRPPGAGISDWQVRVTPNKFPALRIEEEPRRHAVNSHFQYMGGCGAHEIIVESPEHDRHLAEQPVEQIERVLRAAQARYQDLMRDRRFQAIIVFKNHGEAAGTSLKHPHWQLIATPVVPRTLRLKHAEAVEYFDRTGECLYCVLAAAEEEGRVRMVGENEHYRAYVPYAAHLPFETWISPREHRASFGVVAPDRLGPLAALLKDVLLRMLVGLDNPAFNLTLESAPRGDEDEAYFLWHLRILPRLSTTAGFELGSGMSINTVLPEEAAAFLRDVNAEVET